MAILRTLQSSTPCRTGRDGWGSCPRPLPDGLAPTAGRAYDSTLMSLAATSSLFLHQHLLGIGESLQDAAARSLCLADKITTRRLRCQSGTAAVTRM